MSRRETRVEAIARADAAQRTCSAQQLAARYLATDATPDVAETCYWCVDTGACGVYVRAYGLARADGGIVVLVWREEGARPIVEALYMLDATRPAVLRGHAELGRHKLADALSKIYNKHVQYLDRAQRCSTCTVDVSSEA